LVQSGIINIEVSYGLFLILRQKLSYLPPWTLQYLQSPLMTTFPGSGDRGTAEGKIVN